MECGVGAHAVDGDIDGAGVHGVGAKRFHMCHDPVGGRILGGMDGLHPTGTDVTIGEVAHVEPLALPVLLPLNHLSF